MDFRRFQMLSLDFVVHTTIDELFGHQCADRISKPLFSSMIGIVIPSIQMRMYQSLPYVRNIFGLKGENSIPDTDPLWTRRIPEYWFGMNVEHLCRQPSFVPMKNMSLCIGCVSMQRACGCLGTFNGCEEIFSRKNVPYLSITVDERILLKTSPSTSPNTMSSLICLRPSRYGLLINLYFITIPSSDTLSSSSSVPAVLTTINQRNQESHDWESNYPRPISSPKLAQNLTIHFSGF